MKKLLSIFGLLFLCLAATAQDIPGFIGNGDTYYFRKHSPSQSLNKEVIINMRLENIESADLNTKFKLKREEVIIDNSNYRRFSFILDTILQSVNSKPIMLEDITEFKILLKVVYNQMHYERLKVLAKNNKIDEFISAYNIDEDQRSSVNIKYIQEFADKFKYNARKHFIQLTKLEPIRIFPAQKYGWKQGSAYSKIYDLGQAKQLPSFSVLSKGSFIANNDFKDLGIEVQTINAYSWFGKSTLGLGINSFQFTKDSANKVYSLEQNKLRTLGINKTGARLEHSFVPVEVNLYKNSIILTSNVSGTLAYALINDKSVKENLWYNYTISCLVASKWNTIFNLGLGISYQQFSFSQSLFTNEEYKQDELHVLTPYLTLIHKDFAIIGRLNRIQGSGEQLLSFGIQLNQ